MAHFNIFDLTTVEDRPDNPDTAWFAVDPAVMYPAMTTHITEIIQSGRSVPQNLEQYLSRAKKISSAAWGATSVARSDVSDDLVVGRAEALECTRLWFTAMLHAAIGMVPMGVHILKNEDWRL